MEVDRESIYSPAELDLVEGQIIEDVLVNQLGQAVIAMAGNLFPGLLRLRVHLGDGTSI
jgi:hypothetical protein